MRVLCAVAVAVLLSAPSNSQMPHVNLMPEVNTRTQVEMDQDSVNDRAFKNTLSQMVRQALLLSWGRHSE